MSYAFVQSGMAIRMLSGTNTSRFLELLRYGASMAALGICVFAAAYLSLSFSGATGHLSIFWPANSAVLAALLLCPRWEIFGYLLMGFVATSLANVVYGMEPVLSMILSGCDTFEIGFSCMLVFAMLGKEPDLTTPKTLVRFMAVAAGVSPGISATIAASASLWLQPHPLPFVDMLHVFYLSDALGNAIITPLILCANDAELKNMFARGRRGETVAVILVFVTVVLAVFGQSYVPVIFLIFPPLILLVSKLGFPGAAIAIFSLTIISVTLTMSGLGPLATVPGLDGPGQILLLQAFLVTTMLTAFSFGSVLTERHRVEVARMESEVRYRLLAENSTDVIIRSVVDGPRIYVSPAVTEVTGWSVAEFMELRRQDIVHPDDLFDYERALRSLETGAPPLEQTFRMNTLSKGYVWVEARIRKVGVPGVTGIEWVANIRDISERKHAEALLAEANRSIAVLAATDQLTGLSNRRVFDNSMDTEWRRAMRIGSSLSLIILDVDHFKGFNDTYGHPVGDRCLRAVADAMTLAIKRPGDVLARYGGEEFAVILPSTDLEGAVIVAERVREAVEALQIPHQVSAYGVVTISVGVAAVVPVAGSEKDCLISETDAALYAAKRAGRNRVVGAAEFTASAV